MATSLAIAPFELGNWLPSASLITSNKKNLQFNYRIFSGMLVLYFLRNRPSIKH